MRGPSPFHHRSPITDPSHFFGRQREIETVLARTAGATKPQCVSIVGSRRMGKSSLLRQLADVHGAGLGSGDSALVSVYHDLEGSGASSVSRFFRTLHRRLEKQLGRGGSAPAVSTASDDAEAAEEAFLERVEELSDEGVRVVLYLDEFDTVTLNPHFDADLFGRLRYLASGFQLAYVTSSFSELTELCHQQEIRQSPFFNIFSTLHLGLLPQAAAEELLLVESERAGSRFSADEVAFVQELAGRHAFHLHQAANALWEAGPSQPGLAVRRAFLEDAAPHFRYALAHLSSRCARTLLGCAAGEATEPQDADVAFLVRRGTVVIDGQVARPFSPAFGEWLLAQDSSAEALRTPVPTLPRRQGESGSSVSSDATTVEQSPMLTPQAGQRLDGRYLIRRELGSGGFGVVLEAEDSLLGRAVAIKVLRPDRAHGARGASLRERFLHEARAASRIHHPNVVLLHDVREHASGWYIVMEYFQGMSVRELLEKSGPLPVLDALSLAKQAADGLAAAHALGIVHRDVKPENMIVNEHGELKLVDFGLAHFTAQSRLTASDAVFMTPRYSSPEQVLNESSDARSDVFSLGCVIQELLTGEFAFDGSSTAAILHRILNHTPPPSPPRLEAMAVPLRAMVERCLAREPADRWPSCADLAMHLESLRATIEAGDALPM